MLLLLSVTEAIVEAIEAEETVFRSVAEDEAAAADPAILLNLGHSSFPEKSVQASLGRISSGLGMTVWPLTLLLLLVGCRPNVLLHIANAGGWPPPK
jgi:hypothetical protein